MKHLDTSFLVDLMRELGKGRPGPASALLDTLTEEALRVSVHVECELLAGAELARAPDIERARVRLVLASLEVTHTDERFAPIYADVLAELTKKGRRIATMDLLIASAALADGAPLVTRNAKHFARVPGLTLVPY